MVKVTASLSKAIREPFFICDYSPPKSGVMAVNVIYPDTADFVLVNSSPGLSVRASSSMVAAYIQSNAIADTIFTIVTRDMNKLALDSLILGGSIMGLRNVVVVAGDRFRMDRNQRPSQINDYRSTDLIRSIVHLNQGIDCRGVKLDSPADICVGSVLDLSTGLDKEVSLVHKKIVAGAEYFIAQPVYEMETIDKFYELYRNRYLEDIEVPILWGIQIPDVNSISLTMFPDWVEDAMNDGEDPVPVALQMYESFRRRGLTDMYIVPTIYKGGHRNYASANMFMSAAKQI